MIALGFNTSGITTGSLLSSAKNHFDIFNLAHNGGTPEQNFLDPMGLNANTKGGFTDTKNKADMPPPPPPPAPWIPPTKTQAATAGAAVSGSPSLSFGGEVNSDVTDKSKSINPGEEPLGG